MFRLAESHIAEAYACKRIPVHSAMGLQCVRVCIYIYIICIYIYIIHTVFVCFCACDKCLLTQFAAELKDLDLVAWDPERNMPTTRLQR